MSEGSNVAITTNSIKKDTIQKVTAVDQLGNVYTLQKVGVGLYTMLGLKTGIYLLNIQVNVPNDGHDKTYQTILVLLENGAKPLVFNQVTINNIVTKVEMKLIEKIKVKVVKGGSDDKKPGDS